MSDGIPPLVSNSERINDWFSADCAGVGSLRASCLLSSIYLLSISYLKSYMNKRRSFDLNRLVFLYDVFMVVFNAYMVKEALKVGIDEDLLYKCKPRTEAPSPQLARVIWLFHISKVVECMDTVFFILRGKLRLVTWLHVYHHSTMIPYTWMLAYWHAGEQAIHLVLVNGSIHVIMYTYYAIAALGPAWRRYLWWKRYLTILQMIQFVSGIWVCIAAVAMGCVHYPWFYYCTMVYIATILCFFCNHYHQVYKNRARNSIDSVSSSGKMNPEKSFKED
ncbi:unnamed protein product [Calicophoron daubneyi]|uniref:Elongation of very long chain fatty acids protein n=1 Tax=Calicophoron daubneyi TaxID=300641 RepID=A0AAV2T0B9_CALDB